MFASLRLPLLAAAVAALAAAGCGSSSPNTGASDVTQLVILDISVGTGAAATSGHAISVDYTGWLYDPAKSDGKGTQIDTSVGRGVYPFVLGRRDVIDGWDQGVVGMKVGGQRRLTIPSSLAYGAAGRPPAVPGSSALVFDITLVSVD
jgi:FKBP-type peptidyl-prolyl cis-trans isomerase FkpA